MKAGDYKTFTRIFLLTTVFFWNSLLWGGTLKVSPNGTYSTITEALNAAQAGDSILISPGIYDGPLIIDKSISLVGEKFPIIDGRGKGTVILVTAPNVTITGFRIRNSGISLNNEDAGISINARRATIENNQIEDVLFGVYLRKADSSLIQNNIIKGKPELEIARRGDLIRAWYTNAVRVENNRLFFGRDVIIWFSKNSIVKNNRVSNARYGIHFMYSDDCLIEHNALTGNSVGVYLMYSKRLTLRKNTIAYNRGPSGFGIGLKDFDDGLLEENVIVDNRVGIFVDNSPREVNSRMTYHGNVIAYNDVGISLLAFIRRSHLYQNSFIENYEQVGIIGSGEFTGNQWDENYWSDYAGFDADHDGLGDIPYKSQNFYEELISRKPQFRLFIYSPAIQALDFTTRAFPMVTPRPKLMDKHPRIAPYFPSGIPHLPLPARWPLLLLGLGLVSMGIFIQFGISILRFKTEPSTSPDKTTLKRKNQSSSNPYQGERLMIKVNELTKRFGNHKAVNQVSFTIEKGQAMALWGSNGAGKTTILRCLLGIIPFEGEVFINGFAIPAQGKEARKIIGFVPQEISFHDNLTVAETMNFYARLKRVELSSQNQWLEKVGLSAHLEKRIKELSGGMKQRLALAIALLNDPPVLFLDEPTANLDMHSRDEFLGLLTILKQEGKTILYSSHRMEEVFGFADRILVLDQGRVIADAPPTEIYQQLGKHSLLRIYVPEKF
ncbi:MAG: nitrous oxide reductase family maturation protein NosD, partial [Calditrichaeota bacterium]